VTLNGRDLWLENTSDSNGNTTRLWNMFGKITGTGNVHVDVDGGSDRVRIGFNGNDFVGDVFIDRGMLQGGNGSGTASNAIPDATRIIMAPGTLFGVGVPDTIGALEGGAADPGNALAAARVFPNISTTSVSLTVGGANKSGTFSGSLTNDPVGTTTRVLSLTKTGTGTQVFNHNCSFTGNTTLSAGKLFFNGTYTSNITVSGGATLGGTGTSTGSITATATANGGATVAPGNSTGTLTAASANLSTGGNLAIEIDDAATPKNDKLVTTGTLNITNAKLNLSVTGTAAQPAYVIASYGTLTGTFATIPAGFTVDYAYNDGVGSNNIAILPISDPYMAWATAKGLTAANDGKQADPDGDGFSNGLEFYLDGNPLVSDSPGMQASIAGTNLRLTYKRRDDAESLNVTPETSPTLASGSWTTAVAGIGGVAINVSENGAAPDDVEVLLPIGTHPRLFGRLRLTLP
jgi:autotransporter-associated beta strand protein